MTHPTVTLNTIPSFDNVFESFKIFASPDMKRKGNLDFTPIISQTFLTMNNLIDFRNTEI